jgi:hypothetical protein
MSATFYDLCHPGPDPGSMNRRGNTPCYNSEERDKKEDLLQIVNRDYDRASKLVLWDVKASRSC